VRRDRCDEDRRARYAVLTDAGTAFVREAFPRHAAAVHAAMAGLTQEEQLAARALLRRLGTAAAALEVPDLPDVPAEPAA